MPEGAGEGLRGRYFVENSAGARKIRLLDQFSSGRCSRRPSAGAGKSITQRENCGFSVTGKKSVKRPAIWIATQGADFRPAQAQHTVAIMNAYAKAYRVFNADQIEGSG